MRANLPVTGREYEFPDHATLMSTTDIHSHITYANAAFQQVSGFEREDILGQPHNMVRHPDMPPEAFQDMWNTLRRGEPWTALVKNRRKDGDHYWVRANATPVARDGRTVGYMSVRTKPSRGEVQAAEALYRNFREGRAAGLAFHKGLIVRKGWRAWMSLPQTLPLRWRLRGALAGVALFVPGCLLALGLGGAVVAMAAAAAAVGALLACLLLEQQVSRPMEAVLAQALQVASGQTDSVQMNRVDEIGMTLRSINQLGLMFRWIIDDVSDQVVNVQVATDEISQGNTDLSVRTEQAASSLQQTASSMTEMTATIRTNADTALQASQLASSATLAAAQGGQAVAEVVSTMHDISARSSKISEIIGVIDGIAFQTNILALNAAVEAARAGEQGRGFAVVAGEVRSLARRSAEAAREIKALIGASVEKVDSGSRLVDEAGRAMEGIVTQVRSVSQLIGEISAATQEQSAGIEQVGGAVTQLDEVTQQNAALVEQSASASESLRQQADRLVEAVSVFRNA